MRAQEFINEEKVRLDPKCWTGKKIGNPKTKMKGGVRVNNCVPAESVAEMDGDGAGRDGSNRKRISSYGNRDRDIPRPDVHLGPEHALTRKQATKKMGDVLDKEFEKSRKKGVAEGADDRKQNALWAQITAHEKAAAKSKDLKQQHHLKMADQLRSQLKTSDNEQGVAEGEQSDLRKLQQQWWVALPAIMKKAGLDYHPVKELSRDYYPTLGWITIPGEQFTTFDVNANPKGDAAKINISVDVDTSNEFYRTSQPERAAKLNAFAKKIAQALGGTAAEHMTGQRKNHPGVSRITATVQLPKEPAEWQNPSRSYDPRARFLNTPGERARQSRAARSGFPDSYGGDASNYRLEGVAEGDVVAFPKKHKGDLDSVDSCVKCGGDLQGGTYMGHKVKVCIPCKQVYLPPNSNIDQQGNKIEK